MEMTRDPAIHPVTFSHATLGTPGHSTLLLDDFTLGEMTPSQGISECQSLVTPYAFTTCSTH